LTEKKKYNPVLERLEIVAETCFGSRPNLARAIGKRPDTLNGYYKSDSVPGGEFLAILREQGISADWLLSGDGSMFADNEAGRTLAARAQGGSKGGGNAGVTMLGHYMESGLAEMPVYAGKLPADVVAKIISLDELQILERVVGKLRQLHQSNQD